MNSPAQKNLLKEQFTKILLLSETHLSPLEYHACSTPLSFQLGYLSQTDKNKSVRTLLNASIFIIETDIYFKLIKLLMINENSSLYQYQYHRINS